MAFRFGDKKWPGLAKMVEEAGELNQVLGKLIMTGGDTEYFGKDIDLKDKLEEEIADLHATITWFVMHNDVSAKKIAKRSKDKQKKYTKWHEEGLK